MQLASNLPSQLKQLGVFLSLFICALLVQAAEATSTDTDTNTNVNGNQVQGSLVIIGGALRPDNAEVWQRIVQQAGGVGAKIVVIPTASGNPQRSGDNAAAVLQRYGARATVLPLTINAKDHPYQEMVRDPQVIQQINQANGVYFTGGDQARITQALVQSDGQKTPLLNAIWALYQRGGVIAGTSAGAAIMSSTMFYDSKSRLTTLKQGVHFGKELAAGLGFIGNQVFVDQHVLVRGRFARMILAMSAAHYQLGLGIDENTAMVVTHQDELEVIGYKGALVIDMSEVNTDVGIPELNMQNVKIGYLDRGDKFNLRSKVLTPSADKIHNPINPSASETDEAIFSNDILGNNALTDLIGSLLDNKRASAIGLAFSDGTDQRPELGFEFEFKRTADTVGYLSSSTESFTAMNIRLDIRPVKIRFPWYY